MASALGPPSLRRGSADRGISISLALPQNCPPIPWVVTMSHER